MKEKEREIKLPKLGLVKEKYSFRARRLNLIVVRNVMKMVHLDQEKELLHSLRTSSNATAFEKSVHLLSFHVPHGVVMLPVTIALFTVFLIISVSVF